MESLSLLNNINWTKRICSYFISDLPCHSHKAKVQNSVRLQPLILRHDELLAKFEK